MEIMNDRSMESYYAWIWLRDDPENKKTIEYARKWNEKYLVSLYNQFDTKMPYEKMK